MNQPEFDDGMSGKAPVRRSALLRRFSKNIFQLWLRIVLTCIVFLGLFGLQYITGAPDIILVPFGIAAIIYIISIQFRISQLQSRHLEDVRENKDAPW